MEVYILVEDIDLGYRIIRVYADKARAYVEKNKLAKKKKEDGYYCSDPDCGYDVITEKVIHYV